MALIWQVAQIWLGLIVAAISLAIVRGELKALMNQIGWDANWHRNFHEQIGQDEDERHDD